ncbi:sec24-like protein [Amylocystis lapponica]|nr:sec24-like protein [Amylocystis lapponica]
MIDSTPSSVWISPLLGASRCSCRLGTFEGICKSRYRTLTLAVISLMAALCALALSSPRVRAYPSARAGVLEVALSQQPVRAPKICLRAAIDPHSIPSPIDAIEIDRDQWEEQQFMTLPGSHVPLSTTDYVAIDQGNSSPRYMRVSTWNIPSTSRLASDCEIPIVAVIQPLADQDAREEPVPGYINPWCKWITGGTRWKCNLCDHETEVAAEYFCNLDANLMRLDQLQRPELNKGTVDFAVSEEYWAPHPPPRITPLYQPLMPEPLSGNRKPQPLEYLFAFDVSAEAIQSGFTNAACLALLGLLYPSAPADGSDSMSRIPSGCKIAIISYDRTVHFYELSPREIGNAPMLVVSDLEDVFVPLQTGLFVDPQPSRRVITALLSSLGVPSERQYTPEAALGSVLTASLATLAGRGGQVVVFPAVIPTIGFGALNPLVDETTLFGTDKEKTLFHPRDEGWRELAEQCAEEGVGVSMFLGMSKPIDIASIGVVSSVSGGELFFHPRFNPDRDSAVLASQLRRLLTRTTGYSCMMRVRCSNGLSISLYLHFGNFLESSATDLAFGTLDADKAISVQQLAFIQCAVLYTTAAGQRRVRVCNLALQVASLAGTSSDLRIWTPATDGQCAAILLGYRKHCAASAAPSQLIIPEAFRALPVYTLAIMKSKPLKGRNITADVRNYYGHKIMGMSVRSTMQHVYPRMLAVHDLDQYIALPDPVSGQIDLPSLMRDSYMFMESYGEMMVMWIGSSVSPQVLKDLLDVDDITHVDTHITFLPHLESRLSMQVRNIIAHRNARRGWAPRLLIARQNMDGIELEFSDMLVEDQNNAAMSYLDYLCLVHKQINTVLTGGTAVSNRPNFKSTPW